MIRLYTSAQMHAADQAAAALGLPTRVLMELAGHALARAARELADDQPGGVVLCGKGNNGGDGLVAARWLAGWGLAPRVFLAGEPPDGDAAANLALLCAVGVPVAVEPELAAIQTALAGAPVAIDALLGTGLGGPPREPLADWIRALDQVACPVLSADVPSGLDSDTGQAHEPHVRASITLTFGGWKRGLAVGDGVPASGRVRVVDIGLPPAVLPDDVPVILARDDIASLVPARARNAHKGTAGSVLIIGGSRGLGGAPLLAARAAARAGAGLVTAAVPESLSTLADLVTLEVMTRGVYEAADGSLSPEGLSVLDSLLAKADAVAIGPGIGTTDASAGVVQAIVAATDERETPLVIDADGLNLLARQPDLLKQRQAPVVLTPHPGEAARLLATDVPALQADPIGAAEQLAERFGAVAVLKFAHTVIVEPGGRCAVNTTGTPAMASGGMGDALTGVITALLAQGLEPWAAAAAGAWLHGCAGSLAAAGSDAGLLAGDLIDALPRARRTLRRTLRSEA